MAKLARIEDGFRVYPQTTAECPSRYPELTRPLLIAERPSVKAAWAVRIVSGWGQYVKFDVEEDRDLDAILDVLGLEIPEELKTAKPKPKKPAPKKAAKKGKKA
jgi:hypothetical protein